MNVFTYHQLPSTGKDSGNNYCSLDKRVRENVAAFRSQQRTNGKHLTQLIQTFCCRLSVIFMDGAVGSILKQDHNVGHIL